ncbi:MAG TPA: SRPBCC family protein [Candidatus Limnocylindrales bacterium]|nr:SRPBCC family protein [Candidatus Limnocylindrales bacterium]
MQIITHNKHAVNMTEPERIASAIGGGLLAVSGATRRGLPGIALAALGGELIRRGITGHCYAYEAMGIRSTPVGQGASTSVPYELGVRVDRVITINRPRAEVYRCWRDLRNLGRAMRNVESVTQQGDRSHWVVKAPAGRTVEWDAVIHNEVEGELIAWRSLSGDVQNAGSVLFRDAPNGGTEVKVELQYNPPGGAVGALFAKLWGREPGMQIDQDLQRFKQMIEGGEISASGGGAEAERLRMHSNREVDEASEDSFPASDAPAYNH